MARERISVLLRTIDFRADHAADVAIAHEILSGETVEALVVRLLKGRQGFVKPECEWIELRVVVSPETPR